MATLRDDGPVDYLAIARILAPHGIRGELRTEILSDFPDRFAQLDTVYLGNSHRSFKVAGARRHKNFMLMRLVGVDSIAVAEGLRGNLVFVRAVDAVPLPEGHYFWHQIIGLTIVTNEGRVLGPVAEILRTGSNDVYVVRSGAKEILIPAIDDVVKEIDLERGRIVIVPIAGLLD